MDIRTEVANRIGMLTLSGLEALATVKAHEDRIRELEAEKSALVEENKKLKETQSAGAAQAVDHLKANGHAVSDLPPGEPGPP